MYCMCEYKNKSEAFTAVIALISLYNSVACHETHMRTQTRTSPHTHSSTCIYRDADTHTRTYSSLRWEESSNGHGNPGHLACKRL